jgi:hypothetical protein
MIWRIRGCPHCGGDTFLDKDGFNVWIENCLQCGYDAVLKKVDSKPHLVRLPEKKDVQQVVRSR